MAMRVDYTLPALQPGTLPELPGTQDAGPTFRERLRNLPLQQPVSWEQELHLDARPFTATYIGPPPRPNTMELNDAETERSRWRNMLWRHSRSLEPPANATTSSRRQSVQSMLEMLQDMQQMEDDIVAQSVAVTRG